MPSSRRLVEVLTNRRLPLRTRLDLLRADVRRRLSPRATYRVRYGATDLFLEHDGYDVDWETLKSIVSDGIYDVPYRGAVVLDIGAHKGYYAAHALVRGVVWVISFEPEDANAELLARSIESSTRSGQRWELERVAVGSTGGDAELHVMEGSWGHALEPPESWAEYEVDTQRVRVLRLAEILARIDSNRPSGARVVVKLNIEGAESDVVLGTPIEAWYMVDEVIVATHPWAPCRDSEIESHLADAGLTKAESGHPRMLRMRRAEPPRADRRSDPR